MAAGASPIRTDGGSSAVIARTPAQIPPNPAELAQKLLNENGGAKKPNLSELQRKLDAISIQDGALGGQIRAEVEKLLTPVQRGQLASATYMQDGVKIVPNGKSLAEQFRAPASSADRANYNALDKRYGDGNIKTNDSVRIQQKINEQIASGLPLAKFLAQDRAVEKDWTAKAGDFLANFSPTGLLLEAAQPGIAALAKSAGLGNSEWGAHLQRVLDTPGTARALNAGIQEGLVEGAKSFVVDIASIAGKAAQYVGDVSPGGYVGDAARWATPDAVKGWLKDIGVGGAINAVVPSAKRGYENTQALAKAGEAVGSYFANHTPGQVADDVKAKIGQMWDGIKADHAKAVAKGPEAEARWWGKIVGRATFEVASTFVPVAGQAGKVAKGAQAADKVADVVRATDKVADAVKAGDKVIDATRAGSKVDNVAIAASKIAKMSFTEALEGLARATGDEAVAYANRIAELSTHSVGKTDRVVLGKWPGYINEAKLNGGKWYETPGTFFDTLKSKVGSGADAKAWLVNEAFLRQQMSSGVGKIEFTAEGLAHAAANGNSFTARELKFVADHAKEFGYVRKGSSWIKQ
jgi:hypothetical protein